MRAVAALVLSLVGCQQILGLDMGSVEQGDGGAGGNPTTNAGGTGAVAAGGGGGECACVPPLRNWNGPVFVSSAGAPPSCGAPTSPLGGTVPTATHECSQCTCGPLSGCMVTLGGGTNGNCEGSNDSYSGTADDPCLRLTGASQTYNHALVTGFGTGSCRAAGGVLTAPAVTFETAITACEVAAVPDPSCTANEVCLSPPVEAGWTGPCVFFDGEMPCPPEYPDELVIDYVTEDQRGCMPCQCTAPPCDGLAFSTFSDDDCMVDEETFLGSACHQLSAPHRVRSARLAGGGCFASTTSTEGGVFYGKRTVCCVAP